MQDTKNYPAVNGFFYQYPDENIRSRLGTLGALVPFDFECDCLKKYVFAKMTSAEATTLI